MLAQFQSILHSPIQRQRHQTNQFYLKKIQDQILNTLECCLPPDFNFKELALLYEKESNQSNTPEFIYKLIGYLTKIVKENFISLSTYFLLQQQTQKLESTIRTHIKMEQEMKMYLEHLEYKVQRYDFYLNEIKMKTKKEEEKKIQKEKQKNIQRKYINSNQSDARDSLEYLKKKQTQLLKERLVLLKKVDSLQRKLKDQQIKLRRLNSPASSTIQLIKSGIFMQGREDNKTQGNLHLQNAQINVHLNDKQIDISSQRRHSCYSICNDNQMTKKKISIPNRLIQHIVNPQFGQNFVDKMTAVRNKQNHLLMNENQLERIEKKKQIINQMKFQLQN